MAKMSVSGTPGTASVTLNAAIPGFQTFAAAGLTNGQTFSYNITDVGSAWEVGRGVYTSSGTSFTRGPLYSSNGNAAINATGNAQVTIVMLAEDLGFLPLTGGTLTGTTFAILPVVDGNRVEVQRTVSPLNFAGTHAAFVVQQSDSEAAGANQQIPSAVFIFDVTGEGVVSLPSNSQSFWWGLQVNMTKSNDGSGQAITTIGQLGTIGATGYNELSLYDGIATNLGSTNGYISLFESVQQDGISSGSHFDTRMAGIISRTVRRHNGSKLVNAFMASSEGAFPVDAILTTNINSPNTWKQGIDFTAATFSSGVCINLPNNTNISWTNVGGTAGPPAIGTSTDNHTFVRSLANTSPVTLEDFQGAPILQGFNYGGTVSVNNLKAVNAPTGIAPALEVVGTDTNISLNLLPKGSGSSILGDFTGTPVVQASNYGGASPVNWVKAVNAPTTGNPALQAVGSDTNINLALVPKGAGVINIGTIAATIPAVPANFSANRYVAIEVNGVGYFLPLATAAW